MIYVAITRTSDDIHDTGRKLLGVFSTQEKAYEAHENSQYANDDMRVIACDLDSIINTWIIM